MKNDRYLIDDPIPSCIRRLAVPASIGFFFHTMYNVVDTYFAGLIGTTALAALSLSFPVFFVVIAVGSGLQTGTTALIASALGADDTKLAKVYSTQAMSFGLITSVVLTMVAIWLAPHMYRSMGAEGAYLEACLEYMIPVFYGTFSFVFVYMFNAILTATGDTKSFRNFLMLAAVLNCIFDPWFVYGGFGVPAMGLKGIAYATVVIEIAGAVYLGYRAWKTGMLDRCTSGACLPRMNPFMDIARQGLPAAFNMVTVGVGIYIITYFIAYFGKEAVAAYGIATRVEQIVLMPTIGLNTAVLTLVAQNAGAGRYERVRETLSKVMLYGAYMMGAGTLIVYLGAEPLMAFFTDDAVVIAEGVQYLRIAAILLYAYVVLFSHVACMQGLKKPMFAVGVGLYRQILAPIAIFWLFTRIFDFSILAIWFGIFCINTSAAIYSWLYARNYLNRNYPQGS